MIHYLNSLSVTEKLYESMQPSGNDMRFAAIESNLAEYTKNCVSWHWHEYVEFAYVVEGVVDCCTPRQNLTLREGEGYFVNANVLHMNRMSAGSAAARFRILQFDASLLSCAGILARRYIVPVEKAGGLSCVALSPGNPEQSPILSDMVDLFQTAAREPRGYELQIASRLFELWRHFYCATEEALKGAPAMPEGQSQRIKAMLAFIHTHFADPVSVADIAASANISQREAHRTFRQVLGMSPGAYLQQYRVDCAARLLTETDESVTNIGSSCGFSSPNYFCMAFKERMGTSPREFRRR